MLNLFRRIRSKHGIYGVLGNSDYTGDRGMCILCHQEGSGELDPDLPIKVLRNSHAAVEIGGENIYICGTEDPVSQKDDLTSTLRDVPEEATTILLSHSPKIVGRTETKSLDLILCGHTHGGQVRLPFITKLHNDNPLEKKYRSGLYELENSYLYVNRGIGTSFIPVRFLCRPEITVFGGKE